MRISAAQRTENENRIRAAMDRLLRGEIPSGGKCDVKALALESGVDRTAFYGGRPYARLREEFGAKLAAAVEDGDEPDPRDAQIGRMKTRAATLAERLARQDAVIAELTGFKARALSRIAAQHDEITRLRREVQQAARVRRLHSATS
ncbi:MAG TPA: hypothetical protein VMV92_33855 [Streptosporangiaceae bacterium]|nr:hypothetical protein [Streptosporangiaceae bacterium]